jgi:hypothetical protein
MRFKKTHSDNGYFLNMIGEACRLVFSILLSHLWMKICEICNFEFLWREEMCSLNRELYIFFSIFNVLYIP